MVGRLGSQRALKSSVVTRRVFAFVLTLVVSTVWLIPSASPSGIAYAQTVGAGVSVTGDFRGAGGAQIASLYDPADDLGLRISLIERAPGSESFAATQWFAANPGEFDLGRMKLVATDANFDGKTDLVALYDDGGTSVRLLVWLSTGSSFTFTGTAGWWQSNGYAWSRTKAVLAGNFSAIGHNGLLFIYQYDNFQMRIHYLESDGKQFIFNGNQGVYDSGPGQYDTARARFAIGRFTRSSGPDQIASIYQYPNFQIKIHVFDPSPTGLVPVNGWAGVWASAENTYDLSRAKIAATDVDGDGKTDLLGFYWYGDGSVRVHLFSGAKNLALIDTAGIASFAPFTMPWLETRVVAGDWDRDGKGDLATLTSLSDGTTHVGTLRSNGAQLAWSANSWVSAAATAPQRCAGCWPLNGVPANGSPLLARRTLAVKIDNAPTARPHYGISQADMMVELLVEGFITRSSSPPARRRSRATSSTATSRTGTTSSCRRSSAKARRSIGAAPTGGSCRTTSLRRAAPCGKPPTTRAAERPSASPHGTSCRAPSTHHRPADSWAASRPRASRSRTARTRRCATSTTRRRARTRASRPTDGPSCGRSTRRTARRSQRATSSSSIPTSS